VLEVVQNQDLAQAHHFSVVIGHQDYAAIALYADGGRPVALLLGGVFRLRRERSAEEHLYRGGHVITA
jgi:hypothetical protein